MIAIAATLIAMVLAFCLAVVGDLLIHRQSVDLFEWNQSFLVGLSVTALAFVPASILLPGNALTATAVCLIVVGLLGIRRLFGLSSPQSTQGLRFALQNDKRSMVFLIVIGLVFFQFIVQNARFSYFWDGYQIWATKALVMYHTGALGKQWVAPGEQERLTSYPHIVPLYEALVARIQGAFAWEALKPVFTVFYLSLLVAMVQAARLLVSLRIALAVTALVALLPAVSTRFSVGGYADMPQAAFLAATIAALLQISIDSKADWRTPAPWLIGGLALVKNEGLLLALIVCTTVIFSWLLVRPAGLRARFRPYRSATAIVAGSLSVRLLSMVWLHSNDPTYGPLDQAHFARAYANLLTVPRLCIQQMLIASEWGVFWPAFGLAVIIVALLGSQRERAVVAGTAAALAAYTSIFYMTNWELSLHISQAFNRLLVQIAPLAALAMGVAYSRVRGERPQL